MFLSRVEVRNLRNLTSVSLLPSPGINIIEGRNGSGKTSLLESIHLLALARSFRTLKTGNIVQYHHDSLTIFAELSTGSVVHRIGLQRFRDNKILLRLNGQSLTKRAELVSLIPLQLITPESLLLITGSPKERRQYLDWVMFHVEHTFPFHWSAYQRALKQRNAVLRSGNVSTASLTSWDRAVTEHGNQISDLRRKTLIALQHHIERYITALLPGIEIGLSYRQGWKTDTSLSDALLLTFDTDRKQKFTSVGPHRADIKITVSGLPAADHLSRGQLKLLLCALKLGQMSYLNAKTAKHSIVLLDDLPAELDAPHRQLLLQQLHELHTQVFITATDRLELAGIEWEEMKVFHVEHGEIKEVL